MATKYQSELQNPWKTLTVICNPYAQALTCNKTVCQDETDQYTKAFDPD